MLIEWTTNVKLVNLCHSGQCSKFLVSAIHCLYEVMFPDMSSQAEIILNYSLLCVFVLSALQTSGTELAWASQKLKHGRGTCSLGIYIGTSECNTYFTHLVTSDIHTNLSLTHTQAQLLPLVAPISERVKRIWGLLKGRQRENKVLLI